MVGEAVAALLGAAVGAGGSVITAVVLTFGNWVISKTKVKDETAAKIRMELLEYRLRQINELYGPLSLLIAQNGRLAKKLREGKHKPDEWRLLNNVETVLADSKDSEIVREIINIDEEIEIIIKSKGGLIEEEHPPEVFELLLGHIKTLKLAINSGKNPNVVDEYEYYPKGFDEYIRRTHEKIKRDINTALTTKN